MHSKAFPDDLRALVGSTEKQQLATFGRLTLQVDGHAPDQEKQGSQDQPIVNTNVGGLAPPCTEAESDEEGGEHGEYDAQITRLRTSVFGEVLRCGGGGEVFRVGRLRSRFVVHDEI